MAKKKETTGDAAPKKKPAAKSKASASRASKSDASKGSAATPAIDTSLAAQAAARMIANKAMLQSGSSQQGEKESGSFKQLKDSLTKPAAGGMGNFTGNAGGQKKSNLPFGGFGKQVGHNQTIGGDRRNLPRRSGG